MAVYKLMLERVTQYRGNVLKVFCRIVLEICSETKSVVNLISDYLVSLSISSVENTVELDKVVAISDWVIDRGLLWISDSDNVFLPLNVCGYIFKRGSGIETVHVIKLLCGGIVPYHISGWVSWGIAIPSPHVKGSIIYGFGQNCSKKVISSFP